MALISIHLPRHSGGPATQFYLGNQPCVPAAWLAERLLLAGDIDFNPGPKPTLKTLPHTRTQPPPPTLIKYTGSSVPPPQAFPPPLSLVLSPPKTPTSIQPSRTPHPLRQPPHSLHSRPNATYTSRLSPHIPITQTSIRRPPPTAPHIPTPAHSQTRNKQKTSKTKHKEIKILQLNANGIRSTVEELKHLMSTT